MPESVCFDPPEQKIVCRGWSLLRIEQEDPLSWSSLGPKVLLSWPQSRPLPPLPPAQALELRADGSLLFAAPPQPWSLYLEELDPFDLGPMEAILEAAQAQGCTWVVAGPLETSQGGAQDYRYRLYSLLRLLCDRFRLDFSIFEPLPRGAERLNGYLAQCRGRGGGCCRFPCRV